ncbi:hypothetical protein B0H14DRAFT_3431592 [Mycena olivaceomarginata]|nr:hypothetical protein B0H14DRAFT_3431592 [Mycena olivaceomarginata]
MSPLVLLALSVATDRPERLVFNATLHALTSHLSARWSSSASATPATLPTLKKMCLIHRVRSTTPKIESFHQLVSENLTHGLKYLLDALPDMRPELLEAYGDIYCTITTKCSGDG